MNQVGTVVPVPKDAPFIKTLTRLGVFSHRQRWRDALTDRLFEWDSRHGELEMYNNRGVISVLQTLTPVASSSAPSRGVQSMSKHVPIVQRLLSGDEFDLGQIEREIELWHKSDSDLELHDWLGFTWEEYALYAERPAYARHILAAHQAGVSPAVYVQNDNAGLLAARGANPAEVEELRQWLIATGRL